MDELQERLGDALSDRYTIERVAGKGGMATVFLAREHQPERQVALKVLDPDASSLITRTRFLREVDLAGSMVHPHILPIYAAGQVDDLLYCVMPFIEGDSLRQVLARRRTLPVGEALQLVAEVAEALDFAHTAGIIHRGIRPEIPRAISCPTESSSAWPVWLSKAATRTESGSAPPLSRHSNVPTTRIVTPSAVARAPAPKRCRGDC